MCECVSVRSDSLAVDTDRPLGPGVEEEHDGGGPEGGGSDRVEARVRAQPFAVHQLHEDVEASVEERVAHQDRQQVAREVLVVLDGAATRQ
jgi:hypothetical protein